MTVLIELPGTLTDTSGLDRVITTLDGFPDDSLASLFLFEDGSGTAPVNSVSGGAAAIIESLIASRDATSWLSGGGGVNVQGGKVITIPAIDLRTPWTVVSAGKMVGSVGDTTSTKNYQKLSFKASATTNFRGAFLTLTNGGTNWNAPTAPFNYNIRSSNGSGGAGTPVTFSPGNSTLAIGTGRVNVMSYNGVDTITGAIYDKNGNLLQSATVAATDTNLVTGLSGVVDNTVEPIIGPYPSATYTWGSQDVEAAATYTRELTHDDIVAICAAAAALGSARGRAW